MMNTIQENPFSKGNSKYKITATMNNGIDVTLTPQGWAELDEIEVSSELIRIRYQNEMRQRNKGLPPRDMRQIVGLIPIIARNNAPTFETRKKPVNHTSAVNNFLLGKAI